MAASRIRGFAAAASVALASLALIPAVSRAQQRPQPTDRADRVARADDPASAAERVTLDVVDAPLVEVLDAIAKQANLKPAYNASAIPERRVTIHMRQVPIVAAFQQVLRGTGFSARIQTTGSVLVLQDSASAGTGIIIGQVTDGRSAKPLAGAPVTLDDSAATTQTDEKGRYRFASVSTGTHRVTVRSVGFGRQMRVVSVAEGRTAEVSFVLTSSVNTLDQVVVTATGAQRYRELGHVVAVINADSLVRTAPITTFADLLTSRVPGLQVTTSGGTVGGEVALRIRGQTTTHLDPQPIVIVDGVRYKNTNLFSDNFGANNEDTRPMAVEPRSPLNDLNVNDIETVEVVKGPSATTLYGPDAANGVIVITTKRGKSGGPEWRMYVHPSIHSAVPDQRFSNLRYYQAWGHDPSTGDLFAGQCTLTYQYQYHLCTLDSITIATQQATDGNVTVLSSNRPQGQLGASVSGGSQAMQYFVSGNYDTETSPLTIPASAVDYYQQLHGSGALPPSMRTPNTQQSAGFHSSLTTDLGGRGGLTVTAMYDQSSQRAVSVNFLSNALLQGLVAPGEDTAAYYQNFGSLFTGLALQTSQMQTRRLTGSLNGNYRLFSWLNATASLGTDLGTSTDVSLVPAGAENEFYPGQAGDYRRSNTGRTVNLGLSAMGKHDRWSFRSSAGVQYSYSHTDGINVDGSYLAPGSSSISTATQLSTAQIWDEVVQLGSYGEEVVGVNDRLFLTGSLRIDGSTSYGDKYSPRPYPKVGLSWIASDEPWLHGLPGVDQLRFRYSFGAASRAPTSGMKVGNVTSYLATFEGQQQNAYQRNELASPLLRPERTQESEYGMDVTMFHGILDGSLTAYNRRTNDQINTIYEPTGLPVTQWFNVGDVTGHGVEATLTYHAIQRPSWGADVSFNYTYQTTKVTRLSPALPDQYSIYGGFAVGYPLGAAFGQSVVGVADTVGGVQDSIITTSEVVLSPVQYLGVMSPPKTMTLSPSLNLLHGLLRISTLFDRQTGFVQQDPITSNGCADQGLCLAGLLKTAPIMAQANAAADATHFEPGDFTRWREISFTTTIPLTLTRWLRLGTAQVSLEGRNLALWTKYKGPDPESQPGSNVLGLGNGGAFGVPFPRTWSVRFDVLP